MSLLTGKTVVVSGVGAGLGHQIAAAVVRDGGNAVLGARTEEWISHVNTTIDPLLVRQYLAAYFFPRTADGRPNRAAIEAALPSMEKHFAVLDRAVAKTGYLVGNALTLADINLLPILYYMSRLPESGEILSRTATAAAARTPSRSSRAPDAY